MVEFGGGDADVRDHRPPRRHGGVQSATAFPARLGRVVARFTVEPRLSEAEAVTDPNPGLRGADPLSHPPAKQGLS